MKRYLKDMTYTDAMALIENNDSIYERINEYALDCAQDWVSEYLMDCPCDYSVGAYNGYNYFTIDPNSNGYYGVWTFTDFEDWFDKVQHDYGFLSEEEEKPIRDFLHYARIADKLEYHVTAKDKDYSFIVDKVNALKEDSERIILKRLECEYTACAESHYLADLWDCFVDTHDDFEDAYINDDDYKHVFVHVNGHYVKACDIEVA